MGFGLIILGVEGVGCSLNGLGSVLDLGSSVSACWSPVKVIFGGLQRASRSFHGPLHSARFHVGSYQRFGA